jgi:hypothetical protein
VALCVDLAVAVAVVTQQAPRSQQSTIILCRLHALHRNQ